MIIRLNRDVERSAMLPLFVASLKQWRCQFPASWANPESSLRSTNHHWSAHDRLDGFVIWQDHDRDHCTVTQDGSWNSLKRTFLGALSGSAERSLITQPPAPSAAGLSFGYVIHCFLFLFVCCYKTRKSLLRLPSWVRSKHTGSISTRVA